MKLTFNETIAMLQELDAEIKRFSSMAESSIHSEGAIGFFPVYGKMQSARRDLRMLLEKAGDMQVTDIFGDPISYRALNYFIKDLSENKEFFSTISHLLDEEDPYMTPTEIYDLIEHIAEGEELFISILTEFEDTVLLDIDDELYATIREWV